jgi:hypothetical protein
LNSSTPPHTNTIAYEKNKAMDNSCSAGLAASASAGYFSPSPTFMIVVALLIVMIGLSVMYLMHRQNKIDRRMAECERNQMHPADVMKIVDYHTHTPEFVGVMSNQVMDSVGPVMSQRFFGAMETRLKDFERAWIGQVQALVATAAAPANSGNSAITTTNPASTTVAAPATPPMSSSQSQLVESVAPSSVSSPCDSQMCGVASGGAASVSAPGAPTASALPETKLVPAANRSDQVYDGDVAPPQEEPSVSWGAEPQPNSEASIQIAVTDGNAMALLPHILQASGMSALFQDLNIEGMVASAMQHMAQERRS